jgi:hypothetical protein
MDESALKNDKKHSWYRLNAEFYDGWFLHREWKYGNFVYLC